MKVRNILAVSAAAILLSATPASAITLSWVTGVNIPNKTAIQNAILWQAAQLNTIYSGATPAVTAWTATGGWPVFVNAGCGDDQHGNTNGQAWALACYMPDTQGTISWTVNLSHEIVEMLADPSAQDLGMEICDPYFQQNYWIGRVQVSDFRKPDGTRFSG